MRKKTSRFLLGMALVVLGFSKVNAQVVLTVDWSDLSAVKFTATGNPAAINYSDAWSFYEGIALLGFFSNPVLVADIGSLVGSSLSDTANAGPVFDGLSSWHDANPSFYPGHGNGIDLSLWSDDSTKMVFSTSGEAFQGEAIWNLSSFSSYTSVFPGLGATGDVVVWNGNGTLGTWQVVGGSAIPEPSTYAGIAGLAALGLTIWHKRRSRTLPI